MDLENDMRRRLGVGIDPNIAALLDDPMSIWALRLLAGNSSIETLVDLVRRQDALVSAALYAVNEMATTGWAPSILTPTSAMTAAQNSDPTDQAGWDSAIEAAWLSAGILDHLPARIKTLGVTDDELRQIAVERSRLIEIAWNHHKGGEYAASIHIVLAQVDGITHDATTSPDRRRGLSLFSTKKNVDSAIADDDTIAGMHAALPKVRAWFFAEAVTTSIQGALNRNAVLHGRELAYDTRLNSTKSFALLAAVWEWANTKLATEADRRIEQTYEAHAGSQDVDAQGWRMDRRGFSATRDALRRFALAQRAHIEQCGTPAAPNELVSNRLGGITQTEMNNIEFTSTGSGWWATSRSESGWVFGIGMGPNDSVTHYIDGSSRPTAAPPNDKWRVNDDGNWSGDCYW